MDTTKSQEEFEKWAKKAGYIMRRVPGKNAYSYSSTDRPWQAWQAARKSIEVELPDRLFAPCKSGIALEYDEVVEALRAVGIRINGESE